MEFRQLEDFVAVAEEGSFTKAAGRLYSTQPSLSRRIAQLERELRVQLFHRLPGGVTLTPAGETFLVHARRILILRAESTRAVREIDAVRPVRIGHHDHLHYHLLPDVLASFRRSHPRVETKVCSMTVPELLGALEDDRIDVALLTERDGAGEFLASYEILAALPEESPLARRSSVSLGDFYGQGMVTLGGEEYPDSPERVLRHWVGSSGKPRLVRKTATFEESLAYVASGLGFTVLPEQALQSIDSRATVLRRFDPPLFFSLWMVWDPTRASTDVCDFVEVARRVRGSARPHLDVLA
jgi:DNA-binding transcriptional LysR family regulator